MGLLDDIGNIIDDLFGVDTSSGNIAPSPASTTAGDSNNILDTQAQTFSDLLGADTANAPPDMGVDQYINPDGIAPSNWDDPLKSFGNDPGAIVASEHAALLQKRSTQFTTITVDPYWLNADAFKPQLTFQALTDLFGNDGDGWIGNGNPVQANRYNFVSNWRTVPIRQSGTFLKIDFLPSKINTDVIKNTFKPPPDVFSKQDETGFNARGNDNNAFQQPPVSPTGAPMKLAENDSRVVLIQFDDPSGPILIARPGQVFKCKFNAVFVTAKPLSPRIQVIIGVNSEIEDVSAQALNTNPAYAPGFGIWDNPIRHCVPFCFYLDGTTSGSLGINFPGAGGSDGSYFTSANGGNDTFQLFSNLTGGGSAVNLPGMVVGWITGFSFTVMQGAANAAPCNGSIEFFDSRGLLCGDHWISLCSMSNQLSSIKLTRDFSDCPRRFSFSGAANNGLTMTIKNPSAVSAFISGNIEGYVFGPYNFPSGGGWANSYIDRNPYPSDGNGIV